MCIRDRLLSVIMATFGKLSRFTNTSSSHLSGPGTYGELGNRSSSNFKRILTPQKNKKPELKEIPAGSFENALALVKKKINMLQEENKKAEKTLKDTPSPIKQEKKEGPRLTFPGSAIEGVLLGKQKQDTKLGPGYYNTESSIEYFANSQSYNVTNKVLFQEIRKIQQKKDEDPKSLYQSGAIKNLLNAYDSTPRKSAILSSKDVRLSPDKKEMIKKANERHSLRSFNSTTKYGRKSNIDACLLYTSPSPRDLSTSRMPSSA
eukprot:TRINITY_DN6312_c0_g1_i1.p1 TRINITY_DN6312_c0_g1~~TRINITY_DN6312_c0_g1_i1.p1  ORF type:complete len:283 (+),score=78.81 TRINITY_DN6312_c0_g1_i1:64-849(+)